LSKLTGTEKAYKNLDFLTSPAARHIRILCEYEEPRDRFRRQQGSDERRRAWLQWGLPICTAAP